MIKLAQAWHIYIQTEQREQNMQASSNLNVKHFTFHNVASTFPFLNNVMTQTNSKHEQPMVQSMQQNTTNTHCMTYVSRRRYFGQNIECQ